jgi:hypothetical protein
MQIKKLLCEYKENVRTLSVEKLTNGDFGLQSSALCHRTVWYLVGCLGHYSTSRKVVGSIPDVTGFFNGPNPSSCTMAPGSTQPLTEMST